MVTNQFVVRGGELSPEEARNMISPYATVDAEDRSITPTERYDDASPRRRLLVVLLGLYAISKQSDTGTAAVGPVELADIVDETIGTVYPEIRELEQDGLIRNVGKQYQIATDAGAALREQFRQDTPSATHESTC